LLDRGWSSRLKTAAKELDLAAEAKVAEDWHFTGFDLIPCPDESGTHIEGSYKIRRIC
jgi:hypothetical protein